MTAINRTKKMALKIDSLSIAFSFSLSEQFRRVESHGGTGIVGICSTVTCRTGGEQKSGTEVQSESGCD
jgi:hypothetical protein